MPPGLDVREPVVSQDPVMVSGPDSAVRAVAAALAQVRLDPSGIDVNETVGLQPVDAQGVVVGGVDVEPSTVRVTIQIGSQLSTKTLPVSPVVTGTPSPSVEITAVEVQPALVTVEGDADALAGLVSIDTRPVAVSGATADVEATVGLDLPEGVAALGVDQVRVTITIRPRTGTRTFEAGVQVVNGGPDLAYRPAIDRVLLTVGGTLEALDAVDPGRIAALLDVAGLGPGTHRRARDRPAAGRRLPRRRIAPGGDRDRDSRGHASPDRVAGGTSRGDPVAGSHGGTLTMGRLFGTDGIRGVANVDLRPPLAYALGRAVAHELAGAGGDPGRGPGHAALGRDAGGGDRRRCRQHGDGRPDRGGPAHAGPRLPRRQRGVRGGDHGLGLPQSRRRQRPQGARQPRPQARRVGGGRARAADLAGGGARRPEERRDRARRGSAGPRGPLSRSTAGASRRRRPCDLHIVLDCANGAGGATAPGILAATGARVDVIHNEPDGVNINDGCGATAPASLAAEVVARGADLGFALDGDADRLVVVDRHGRVVDGDQLLGVCALDRLARGALPGGILVVTVLSNGGLEAALAAAGGRLVRTPVGDKYILEGMQVTGAGLGGEKSGHVIVLEHATSGDGLVTGLELLVDPGPRRPAPSTSLPPPSRSSRRSSARSPRDERSNGRRTRCWARRSRPRGIGWAPADAILVRPSGTEPALRVMIEGADPGLVRELADELAALAGERLH